MLCALLFSFDKTLKFRVCSAHRNERMKPNHTEIDQQQQQQTNIICIVYVCERVHLLKFENYYKWMKDSITKRYSRVVRCVCTLYGQILSTSVQSDPIQIAMGALTQASHGSCLVREVSVCMCVAIAFNAILLAYAINWCMCEIGVRACV